MAEPRFQVRLVRRRPVVIPPLRVAGPTAEVRPTGWDDVMVWRLLGTNNRELGRSADQFETLDACLPAIEEARALVRAVDQPRIYFTTDEGVGYSWWWTVERSGSNFITAARTFSRQRDCLTNFEQFRTNAVIASVTNSVPERRSRGAAGRSVARSGQPSRRSVSINARGVVR